MKTESKTAIILSVIILAIIVSFSVGFSSLESTLIKPTQTNIQNRDNIENIDKSGFKKAPA